MRNMVRVSCATVAMFCATSAHAASNSDAPPNRFDQSEVGSEAIFILVNSCLIESGGMTPQRLAMCGCRIDSIRFNLKNGTKETAEQTAKCLALGGVKPPPAPQKAKPGKIGT